MMRKSESSIKVWNLNWERQKHEKASEYGYKKRTWDGEWSAMVLYS